MAVTTTPRDILNGAYGRSSKNKPGTIATEATELLQLVIRATRGLYLVGARVNPTYFAEQGDVTFAAGAWARPATANTIFLTERTAATTGGVGAAGDEVALVPYDDKAAEEAIGAVYRMGKSFFSAGNPNDPTGGDLRFYYARRPTSPATLDTALDAMWEEDYNELLMLEVAIYLAMKDGRSEEVGALRLDRDAWARHFVSFLEETEVNERRRMANQRGANSNRSIPIGQLFAGGANLMPAA